MWNNKCSQEHVVICERRTWKSVKDWIYKNTKLCIYYRTIKCKAMEYFVYTFVTCLHK